MAAALAAARHVQGVHGITSSDRHAAAVNVSLNVDVRLGYVIDLSSGPPLLEARAVDVPAEDE